MLLKSYQLEIMNNACMPNAMSVNCFAHLDQDICHCLPYLNTALGGFEYTREPPSVSFRAYGKLITVSARKIAVNALKDAGEAKKIVEWLKSEINQAWENRSEIQPRYEGMPRIQIIEILKLLPKTNCKQCGAPTCLVFATQVAEGAKDGSNCPPITAPNRKKLDHYLAQFNLDI